MPDWCSNGVLRPWIGKERKAVFVFEDGNIVRKPFFFRLNRCPIHEWEWSVLNWCSNDV